jgi:hypothetical protein
MTLLRPWGLSSYRAVLNRFAGPGPMRVCASETEWVWERASRPALGGCMSYSLLCARADQNS